MYFCLFKVVCSVFENTPSVWHNWKSTEPYDTRHTPNCNILISLLDASRALTDSNQKGNEEEYAARGGKRQSNIKFTSYAMFVLVLCNEGCVMAQSLLSEGVQYQ